jgi:PPOX class probable F420-dependent enzyme
MTTMDDAGRTLDATERTFLATARRAILATTAPNGRARLVPICFVLADTEDRTGTPVVYTPLDEKPKRAADPRSLARVRDILARPEVTLLVDRWDEDWSQLAWLRCDGTAALLDPGSEEHAAAVSELRQKYSQYAGHHLEERPLISVVIERATSWGALDVG